MNKIIKNRIKKSFEILLSLTICVVILCRTYRNFDFEAAVQVLCHDVGYGWILLSFIPGTFSHLFRAWRWKLTLSPLGEHPRTSTTINSIFFSYASSLIVPRIGEVARCGILQRYEGTSFAKSLGTVVTERIVDVIFMLLLIVATIVVQMPMFVRFFSLTGTNIDGWPALFTSWQLYLVLAGTIGVACVAWRILRKRLSPFFSNIWTGITSIRRVSHPWLFVLYSVGIWVSFYLEFYIAFFAFPFTATIPPLTAVAIFTAGTMAVLVPTPNGAGPWHFAVITMMGFFGIARTDAATFALLVHSVQTALMMALGVYSVVALLMSRKFASF
ncbi:MAG: lysylphosphatidylglycerol synthase transmembrane domain-containing protein [Bacteroidales bacterium]|nr:lysylphosphatidylglycerol synthase transmembrane domain-containing protein [Bacteroidales bacterium]